MKANRSDWKVRHGYLFMVFLLLLTNGAIAQSTGDYRSNTATAFTWSVVADWDRYDGTSWIANPAEGYPGSAAGTGTVTIQDGHTVTIDVSPANPIGSLEVGNGVSGTLIIGSSGTSRTITITGGITVNTGSTLRTGSNSTGHIVNIGGNLTVNGTLSLYYNTGGTSGATAVFNGVSQQLLGSATTMTMYRITVNNGSTLSYGDSNNTRALTLQSNLIVNGTLQSGSTAAVVHNFLLGGNLTNGGTINFEANAATAQTFTLNGANNQSITGTSTSGYGFYNLTINDGGSAVSFGNNTNERTITVANNLTISGGTLQSGNTGIVAHSINLSGGLVLNGGTTRFNANSATNHTLNFVGTSQTISGTNSSNSAYVFYNVGVNDGTTVSFGNNNTNSRVLNITNALTIAVTGVFQSGSTVARSHTINLSGNLSNSGTFNLTANAATAHILNINGTSEQTISGTNELHSLTINKATGNVSLSGTGGTSVVGVLTLTSGKLASTSTHTLSLTSTATLSGGSASSFVDGPMTKVIALAGSFVFPLGSISTGNYRQSRISSTTAADTWTASYVGSNPNGSYPVASMLAPLQTVSSWEYWDISRAGSSNASITLPYNTGSYYGASVGTVAHLLIGHWNGSSWDQAGTAYSQTGTTTSGTVTATNVSSFSPFTLASTDAGSPLPIELVSFTAQELKSNVVLNWKTLSELNNDYFSIYHSSDGENFEVLATVQGHGTTSEIHNYSFTHTSPVNGKNYYMLGQTDFDRTHTLSKVVMSEITRTESTLLVYPTLIRQQESIHIEFGQLPSGASCPLQVINAQGKPTLEEWITVDQSGFLKVSISTSTLTPGLYIIRVKNAVSKFIVE